MSLRFYSAFRNIQSKKFPFSSTRQTISSNFLNHYSRYAKNPLNRKFSTPVKKFVLFSITGTAASFLFCATWEYETYFSKTVRKITRQFNINFGRPPQSSDVFWVILGFNAAVFTAIRFTSNSYNILNRFALSIQSKPSSLLTSMFTHAELFHIAMNMYVLHSFCPLIDKIGAPHFTAIYLAGGLTSGLGSFLFKYLRNDRKPSIGASGAILAVIGLFGISNPNIRFKIPIISDIFQFSFSAETALASILAFDVIGLLFFKASRFDHVCHISGLLFGVFYGLIGKKIIWDDRRRWMSWYYSLRSTK